MENRKESEIIERISELTGKPKSTLYDWKKSDKNYRVYKALEEYVELKEKERPDFESKEFLKEEISKAINRLPKQKAKKFYHLIMAELTEFE